MQISKDGLAFLERHEGVVLKAYRDPVGIWTIGAGLTKASGVVTPKPGMTLSREQASALLMKAIERNYAPRVAKAMKGAIQREFDGGLSFDFNTGAIHRASWVKAWRQKNWARVEKGLAAWRKASGKVLPGLVARRAAEFELIRWGDYGTPPGATARGMAAELIAIDSATRKAIAATLKKLGYAAGEGQRGFDRKAIMAFQRDHDLTVDGKIGRATLATLQRRIDATRKSASAGGATAAGGAGSQLDPSLLPDWTLWAVLGAGALALLWLAWSYRDVVAVKIQRRAPGLAAKLRSF